MNQAKERFLKRVAEAEQYAADSPAGYRRKLVMLGIVGYLFLAGLLLLLLAALGAMVFGAIFATPLLYLWIIGGLVVIATLVSVLRAMLVQPTPTEGHTLTGKEAPKFFEMIDQVRAQLRAPRVHRVVVTTGMEAAISQLPRLGVLGWYRNELIIGEPLLAGLSPRQVRSVIAHEFAHMIGGETRGSIWAMRLRRAWGTADQELRGGLARLLGVKLFLRWYAPLFDAYSFVARRRCEWDADQFSVRITGADTACAALMRIAALCHCEQEYFDEQFRKVGEKEQPDQTMYHDWIESLLRSEDRQHAARGLRYALKIQTNYDDSHPSLSDRVAAMGLTVSVDDDPPPPPVERALHAYLPAETIKRITDDFNFKYCKSITPAWKERHKAVCEMRERLAGIDQEIATRTGQRRIRAMVRRMRIVADVDGVAAAQEMVSQVLAEDVGQPDALVLEGMHKLEADDPAGLEPIRLCISEDQRLMELSCRVMYLYHRRQGELAEAEACRDLMDEFNEKLARARVERSRVVVKDTLLPHEMFEEDLEQVVAVVNGIARIKRAYLVRKQVKEFETIPLYVLGVEFVVRWNENRNAIVNREMVHLLEKLSKTDMEYIVRPMQLNGNRAMRKRMSKVPGALLLER